MISYYSVSNLFIFSLLLSTLLLHNTNRTIIYHGYTQKLLNKNLFFCFYCYGLYLTLGKNHIFSLHLARRLIETLIFRYSNKNRMSVAQFISGLLYYYFIVHNVLYVKIFTIPFIFVNVLQLIAHYRVFVMKINSFKHYYSEILIYFVVFMSSCNIFFLLNFIWVCVYVRVTIVNRDRMK